MKGTRAREGRAGQERGAGDEWEGAGDTHDTQPSGRRRIANTNTAEGWLSA